MCRPSMWWNLFLYCLKYFINLLWTLKSVAACFIGWSHHSYTALKSDPWSYMCSIWNSRIWSSGQFWTQFNVNFLNMCVHSFNHIHLHLLLPNRRHSGPPIASCVYPAAFINRHGERSATLRQPVLRWRFPELHAAPEHTLRLLQQNSV